VVYAQCSMSVSTQGLVSLGHQDAGGALLGFWELGVSGVRWAGWCEDGGYKGGRSVLLRIVLLI